MQTETWSAVRYMIAICLHYRSVKAMGSRGTTSGSEKKKKMKRREDSRDG